MTTTRLSLKPYQKNLRVITNRGNKLKKTNLKNEFLLLDSLAKYTISLEEEYVFIKVKRLNGSAERIVKYKNLAHEYVITKCSELSGGTILVYCICISCLLNFLREYISFFEKYTLALNAISSVIIITGLISFAFAHVPLYKRIKFFTRDGEFAFQLKTNTTQTFLDELSKRIALARKEDD